MVPGLGKHVSALQYAEPEGLEDAGAGKPKLESIAVDLLDRGIGGSIQSVRMDSRKEFELDSAGLQSVCLGSADSVGVPLYSNLVCRGRFLSFPFRHSAAAGLGFRFSYRIQGKIEQSVPKSIRNIDTDVVLVLTETSFRTLYILKRHSWQN